MSATYEEGDGYTVCISDEARSRLIAEQRLADLEPFYAAVKVIAAIGMALSTAGYLAKPMFGG